MGSTSTPSTTSPTLDRSLGTFPVMVAGVGLVVASSTLVSEFTGYFTFGAAFVIAVLLGFLVNFALALSAADLSTAWPRAGALYDYTRKVIGGRGGRFAGAFLGLTFVGMGAFAIAGETTSGAWALRTLTGLDLPIGVFVVGLGVLAVLPNLFGIRTTAWISAVMVIAMLAIRWFFGIAGFAGWGATGSWSVANLQGGASFAWFGDGGVITAGLAIALWSFVGIEFACSLAEEVKQPKRSMPRGLVLGLLAILATTLVMGLGVAGAAPLSQWQAAAASDIGAAGQAPQLAVGHAMFGDVGFALMAIASVLATLSSLTVIYAAVPRVLFSIARDGHFFGPLSRPVGRVHPTTHTPVTATLVVFALYQLPALSGDSVIAWVYSAAYLWIALYAAWHVLALINRLRHPNAERAFSGRWFVPATVFGVVLTVAALTIGFAGSHAEYGIRALVVLGIALLVTVASYLPGLRVHRDPLAASTRLRASNASA